MKEGSIVLPPGAKEIIPNRALPYWTVMELPSSRVMVDFCTMHLLSKMADLNHAISSNPMDRLDWLGVYMKWFVSDLSSKGTNGIHVKICRLLFSYPPRKKWEYNMHLKTKDFQESVDRMEKAMQKISADKASFYKQMVEKGLKPIKPISNITPNDYKYSFEDHCIRRDDHLVVPETTSDLNTGIFDSGSSDGGASSDTGGGSIHEDLDFGGGDSGGSGSGDDF